MTREGEFMKYPNTFPSKIINFPWKRYWTVNLAMRCIVFGGGTLATMGVFRKIYFSVNTEENARHWAEKRSKYFNSHFDLPKDPKEV